MHAYVRYRYVDRECVCVAYIIKSSPQLISSYKHVNIYIYDESSAPSVRASGAHGRNPLI